MTKKKEQPKSNAESRILTFKEPTEVLTLDELKLTESDQEVEVEHWKFIEDALEILDKKGYSANLEEIYVNKYVSAGNKGAIALKGKTAQYGEGNIQTWLLRRALTLVKINEFMGIDMSYSLALNYLQDGYQIAIGNQVHICKNMCIYGGNIFQTYGHGRGQNKPYKTVLDHISGWVAMLPEKVEEDGHVIAKMQETKFDHSKNHQFFGGLMEMALTNPNAPMYQTEVVDFQREYLGKAGNNPEKLQEAMPTLWDFYNVGTSILRADKTDTKRLLNSNNWFSNFMVKEFMLS